MAKEKENKEEMENPIEENQEQTPTPTPTEGTGLEMEDQEKASELMEEHGVKEVYKVGEYWFVRKDYAERHAEATGSKMKTYN